MYDYGARFYDPSIVQWNSIDPLASDPDNISFSPYAYVWNNPLKYNDPTGMKGEGVDDIIITHRAQDGTFTQVDYGDDGNLYNLDGSAYDGDNAFIHQAANAINDARSTDSRVDKVFSELESSNAIHTVSNVDFKKRSTASYNVPSSDPDNKGGSLTVFAPEENRLRLGNENYSDGAIMTHEFKHAYNREFGLSDYSPSSVGIINEEVDAVSFENLYHIGKGEPIRTKFAGKNIAPVLIPSGLYYNFK